MIQLNEYQKGSAALFGCAFAILGGRYLSRKFACLKRISPFLESDHVSLAGRISAVVGGGLGVFGATIKEYRAYCK